MNLEDPIGPEIRERVPFLDHDLEEFEAEESKRKQDMNDPPVESICEQMFKKQLEDLPAPEEDKKLVEKSGRRITGRMRLVDLQLERRNRELRTLIDEQAKRAINQKLFTSARGRLERQIGNMRLELVALKRQEGVIRGLLWDKRHQLRLAQNQDAAVDHVVDNMVRSYEISPANFNAIPDYAQKIPRGSSENAMFRQRAILRYDVDVEDPKDAGRDPSRRRVLWCPVTKGYHDSPEVVAAHIVPWAIGETNCIYLFGEEETGTGHLMSGKNGLLLHPSIEKAMDKAQLAIVPADEKDPSAERLKVIVFDRDILTRPATASIQWADLDGLELEFKTEHRPGLRYLYFTFLMTIFRCRRFECTGWKTDLMRYASGKAWASPGKWLRGTSLRAMAARIAHEPNLEKFLGTSDLPMFERTTDQEDDELFSDEALETYNAKAMGKPAEAEETGEFEEGDAEWSAEE